MSEPFSLPIVPRYAEVDQQGVVFNGHYLTWFDEASTAFFDHIGVPITEFDAWGLDVQVVHAEIDYLAPVRWRDRVRVEVRVRVGRDDELHAGVRRIRRGDDGVRGERRPWPQRLRGAFDTRTGPSGRFPPNCATRSLPLWVNGMPE